jgi:hypothetical protein
VELIRGQMKKGHKMTILLFFIPQELTDKFYGKLWQEQTRKVYLYMNLDMGTRINIIVTLIQKKAI